MTVSAPDDVLRRILEATRAAVAMGRRTRPEEGFRAALRGAPPPRDLLAALAGAPLRPAVIAEFKRASPSAGTIREGWSPAEAARAYEAAGAAAISVLTERTAFRGSLADLAAVREATTLPILAKDFHLDAWQVLAAREAGADAVLLVVRVLDDAALSRLLDEVRTQGLAALVEVHDEADLDRALAAGAQLIGINNRDLATFHVDLAVTRRLAPRIPRDRVLVAASGYRSPADLVGLADLGVDAILVGEHLMRASEPGRALDRLRPPRDGDAP